MHKNTSLSIRALARLFAFCFMLTAALGCYAAETAPQLPEPAPTVTVYAKMGDGTELPTDLYYPPNGEIGKTYPCLLVRVPAGRKAPPWTALSRLAHYDYVVAIQDTRNVLDKSGKTLPCVADGRDGYDAVEWLANSSFTNGKVGTIGFSAAGISQLMMAPTAPPSLYCQYIGQAAGSLYHHAIYQGGQFNKNLVESWLGLHAPDKDVLAAVKSQVHYNDFWKQVNTMEVAHQVDVPAVHYGGWYDPFLQGTIDSFVARQHHGKEGAKEEQKLLIGPWNHFWPLDLTLGEFNVPAAAKQLPEEFSPVRWFDHHLKERDNGADGIHAVTYFVMGPLDGTASSGNVWRHADQWPIPAKMTTYYLTASRTLTTTPEKESGSLSFESDPANPVPTIGGRNLFLPSGPRDQRSIEGREDVLVFTTEPFAEDMEITGQIVAHLYFTSSVPDTDIAVRLTDVYPDGKSVLVVDGINRTGMAFHNQPKEHLNQPVMLPIDLQATSLVFAKGHRLRISIAGSNYPRYEVNQNRGIEYDSKEPPAIAKTAIHFGINTPSYVLLPIVPAVIQAK